MLMLIITTGIVIKFLLVRIEFYERTSIMIELSLVICVSLLALAMRRIAKPMENDGRLQLDRIHRFYAAISALKDQICTA